MLVGCRAGAELLGRQPILIIKHIRIKSTNVFLEKAVPFLGKRMELWPKAWVRNKSPAFVDKFAKACMWARRAKACMWARRLVGGLGLV